MKDLEINVMIQSPDCPDYFYNVHTNDHLVYIV